MTDLGDKQAGRNSLYGAMASPQARRRGSRWAWFGYVWLVSSLGVSLLWAQAPTAPGPTSGGAGVAGASEASEPAAPLLTNERHPLPGTLTGGVPAEADLASLFQRLADQGARTFIDLRSDAEVKPGTDAAALAAGLDYRRLPVGGEADLDLGGARALDQLLGDWSRYPVVLACGSGNRVGALVAVRGFWLGGMPAEAALALGHAAGLTKLEPSVRLLLGLPPASVPAAVGPAAPAAAPATGGRSEKSPAKSKPN